MVYIINLEAVSMVVLCDRIGYAYLAAYEKIFVDDELE